MRFVPLAVVYYLVITPIGLISRLIYDPLTRRMRNADSYWVPPHR